MNAREVITEELLHMGSFIPHVEANNIIYGLRIAGFVILPRSEVDAKDKEIAALREALEEIADHLVTDDKGELVLSHAAEIARAVLKEANND